MIYELIQVAIGQRDKLSHTPTPEEWKRLYADALKQSVVGVAFEGVQKLPKEQWAPQALLFEWVGTCEQIKAQNQIVNKRSAEISQMLAEAGFRSCILKGQGNALMYPTPFCRMSGDIDIWIDGARNQINQFVRERYPHAYEQEQHIDFPIFKDVAVEIHYKPCTLPTPKGNKRVLEWSMAQKDVQMSHEVKLPMEVGTICVPTADFNVVYQIIHIMTHFFIEGIGLRHFVDYYFALKAFTDQQDNPANLARQKAEAVERLKQFGMLRFARGVMWVEKECLRIEDKYLLVEPDERRGRIILEEMQEGGNFGFHDERYKSHRNGYLKRGFIDGVRLLKLLSAFPSESMWNIYKKAEKQKWKLLRIIRNRE